MDDPSSTADFRRAADHIPGLVWTAQVDGAVDFLNHGWRHYTGMAMSAARGWGWQAAVHPADLDGLLAVWYALLGSAKAGAGEARLRRHDGRYRWFSFRAQPLHDEAGRVVRWFGQTVDIDDFKHAEALLAGENRILERIAKGRPLEETLDHVCRLVEHEAGAGAIAAVMLLDERRATMKLVAAPGIPAPIARAIGALPADPGVNPCAAAAASRETVSVADLPADPRWAGFSAVVAPLGLRAALLRPVSPGGQGGLGVVALFLREAGEPASRHRRLLGQLTHLAAVAVERRRVDLALHESEARLAGLAQTTPDVLWIVDLSPLRLRYASPGYAQLWGRAVSALEAGPAAWLDAVHPEDRATVEASVRRWIAPGAPSRHDLRFRIVRPDGSVRWVHGRGVRDDDGGGWPQRVSGICTDISEWARTEAALRATQERFALAVAGSNDGLWDWHLASDEMFLSERAQRLYGLEPGVTLRRRGEWLAMVRVHPDDAERQHRFVDDYLAGGAPCDGEWRVRHPDGSYRWVRVRGTCVRDGDGRPTRLAGSISDVDPFRRAEAALLQAQRLEAAGTLAEGIAHDFNNILSAILGYGEMAMRDARPGTRLRRDLDSIRVAAERGRSLVDRLLGFSRSNVAERARVHVEGVVAESIELLHATLPPRVRLEPRLQAGLAATLADATLVHQVFTNLATNAMQAMPAGGTLTVSLEEREHEAECVATTGVLPAGRYIVLKVGDTGVGIAPGIVSRIFDPFFTTKEAGAGTGLGLSLVHGLVSSIGGAVEVSSRVGGGSVFTVYFPCVGEAVQQPPPDAPALPRGDGERVLVVDDEAALVTLLTEALGDLGYAVQGHASSQAALDALTAAPEAFDLMVTDERMPGLGGTELVRRARQLRPSMPIVLVSGYLGGRIAGQAREAGATEVLKKPLSTRELALVIARLLGRGG